MHTYTNPRPGRYLMHAHIYITRAKAATDSCFVLIGLLQLAIHVVQNRRAGEQKSHWDKTNNANYHFKLCMAFLVFFQCDFCSPAWRFCTTWMASCKGPIGAYQCGKAGGLMNGETPCLYNLVLPKQSIKRQLHTTHVGAVGWEPHSSSTTTCAGKVDHELPASNLFFCLFSVFPLEPEKNTLNDEK